MNNNYLLVTIMNL